MDRERSAAFLMDVNAAMVGGAVANKRLQQLTKGL